MFIQHLTEEAHAQAKLERKPRRNIQYKDVGTLIRLSQPSSASFYSFPTRAALYHDISNKHFQPMPYHAETTSNS
jgi:hypothetical protein